MQYCESLCIKIRHCSDLVYRRERRFGFVCLKLWGRYFVSWLTIFAFVVQTASPAYAGGISADGSTQTTVDQAANGVPVVNISAPNSAGVSLNNYSDFNVGSSGAVLNNSTNTGQSQLGGGLVGNPHLQSSGSARLILNQVRSANRSHLNGYTEIYGGSAEFVLVNPNGISCNGCGFINAPRVTLGTGDAKLGANGSLQSLGLSQGDVEIGRLGLDASRADYFDIVSRAVEINGEIFGKDVTVASGVGSYDYKDRTVTDGPSASASAGGAPEFSIDGSALGGVYADRVRLIGTEAGVGVRAPEHLVASTGDLEITADGRLVLRNAGSSGRLTAESQSGDLEVRGNVIGQEGVSLAAGQEVSVAGSLTSRAGIRGSSGIDVKGDKINVDGVIASDSDVILDSESRVSVTGVVMSDQSLSVSGGEIDVGVVGVLTGSRTDITADEGLVSAESGVIAADRDVVIRAGGSSELGQVQAGEGVNVAVSSGDLVVSGRVFSGSDMELRTEAGDLRVDQAFSEGALDVSSSGEIAIETETWSSDATRLTSGGGVALAKDSMVSSSASIAVNTRDMSLASGSKVAAGYHWNGELVEKSASHAPADVTIDASQNLDLRSGGVRARDDVSITAGTLEFGRSDGQAAVVAGSDLNVGIRSLNGAGGRLVGGESLSVVGTETLTISNGSYESDKLSFEGASVRVNSGLGSAGDLTLKARTGDVIVNAAVSGNRFVEIEAKSGNLINYNIINSADGATRITVGGAVKNYANDRISGKDLLRIQAGSVHNEGALSSGSRIESDVTGNFVNRGKYGLVFSARDMDLSLGGVLTNEGGGWLYALNDLRIGGRGGGNARGILNSSSTLRSGQNMILQAGTITNRRTDTPIIKRNSSTRSFWAKANCQNRSYYHSSSTYVCTSTSDPYIGSLPAYFRSLHHKYVDDVLYNSNVLSQQQGRISAGKNLTISGNTLRNEISLIESGGNLTAGLTGSFVNQGYTLYRDWIQRWIEQRQHNYRTRHCGVFSCRYTTRTKISDSGSRSASATQTIQSIGSTIRSAGAVNISAKTHHNVGSGYQGVSGPKQPVNLARVSAGKAPAPITSPLFRGKATEEDVRVARAGADGRSANRRHREEFTNSAGKAQGSDLKADFEERIKKEGSAGKTAPKQGAFLPPKVSHGPNRFDSLVLDNPLFDRSGRKPNTRYLIETRREFVDPNQFLGSDYFLDRIGHSPERLQRRIGDAFVETTLIEEQVRDATNGSNLLEGYASTDEMVRTLYNNAAGVTDDLQLSLGVSLSKEQVAALTEDIIWLETEIVEGQEVLVPRVYHASATAKNLGSGGGQIIGRSIGLSGETLDNDGGSIQAKTLLHVNVRGEARNSSGTLSSSNIFIDAESFVQERGVERHTIKNGYTESLKGQAHLDAKDQLVLRTKGDATFRGGEIKAGGDAYISAGGDLRIEARKTETRTEDIKKITRTIYKPAISKKVSRDGRMEVIAPATYITKTRKEEDIYNRTQQDLVSIATGGNLMLSSGKELGLIGVDLLADGDISLFGKDKVSISAAADSHEQRYRRKRFLNESSSTTYRGGEVTAGGQVTVASGVAGIEMYGADITAGESLTVRSVGSVIVEAAENTRHSDLHIKGSGYEYRKTRDATTYDLAGISAQGDVTLESTGGSLVLSGSEVVSKSGSVTGSAAGDIYVSSVEDVVQEYDYSYTKDKGLFGSKTTKKSRDHLEIHNRESRLEGQSVHLKSGGDITIHGSELTSTVPSSGGSVSDESVSGGFVSGGSVSGGSVTLESESGEIAITAGRDVVETTEHYSVKRTGLRGLVSGTGIEKDSQTYQLSHQGSKIKAALVSLKAEGGVLLSASEIEAKATEVVAASLNLESLQDIDYHSVTIIEGGSYDLVKPYERLLDTYTSYGHDNKTAAAATITGESLTINGADYSDELAGKEDGKGTLSSQKAYTNSASEEDPELVYENGPLTTHAVTEQQKSWHSQKKVLNEVGQIVVQTVASMATGGMSAGMSNVMMKAAMDSVMQQVASQLLTSAMTGEPLRLDMESLAKTALVAGVTAGLNHEISNNVISGETLVADASRSLATSASSATIQGLANGTSVTDGLAGSLESQALAQVHHLVGDYTDGENHNAVANVAAHATVGAVYADLKGQDAASGAAAGATATIVGDALESAGAEDRIITEAVVGTGQLAALAAGGDQEDIRLAGSLSRSADLNNRQLHKTEGELIRTHAERFAKEQGLCRDDGRCTSADITQAEGILTRQALHEIDSAFHDDTHGNMAAAEFLSDLGQGQKIAGTDQSYFLATEEQYKDSAMNAQALLANKDLYDAATKYGLREWDFPDNNLFTAALGRAYEDRGGVSSGDIEKLKAEIVGLSSASAEELVSASHTSVSNHVHFGESILAMALVTSAVSDRADGAERIELGFAESREFLKQEFDANQEYELDLYRDAHERFTRGEDLTDEQAAHFGDMAAMGLLGSRGIFTKFISRLKTPFKALRPTPKAENTQPAQGNDKPIASADNPTKINQDSNGTFTTKIDGNISNAGHVALPEGIAKTFRNGEYATVKTTVDTPVYRKFGGDLDQAKANGGFAGTERNLGSGLISRRGR